MTNSRVTAEELDFWRSGNLGKSDASASRLLFGQVREDATIETFLLRQLPQARRAFIIASGGCTAFSLLPVNSCHIDCVDINQAQIYLCELKAKVLGSLPYSEAYYCFTQDAYKCDQLISELSPQAKAFWKTNADLLKKGLNNCGWADRKIRNLMYLFFRVIHSETETREFLSQSNLQQQCEHYHLQWCNWQWTLALKVGLSKTLLSFVFGRLAVEALPANFSSIMEARLKRALTAFPNATNGYLWQTFLGEYPPNNESALPLYLQPVNQDLLKKRLSNLSFICADALEYLKEQPNKSFDFIALSNILELVKSNYKEQLAYEVARVTKPGALICLRSIFPQKDKMLVTATGSLVLQHQLNSQLERMDQSCFCNFIQVYQRT